MGNSGRFTHRDQVIERLKEGWYTGYEMCNEIKSSQALARISEVKKNPPKGWHVQERKKDCDTRCNEYRLVQNEVASIIARLHSKEPSEMTPIQQMFSDMPKPQESENYL